MKKSAFNVAGNLVMGVKFTFQSVFGNSLQNPRQFSARGREESLELYSILWSDWPTSKQEVLRHGNRFVARVRRRYFSEREKRRPEMRLRFAGYIDSWAVIFFFNFRHWGCQLNGPHQVDDWSLTGSSPWISQEVHSGICAWLYSRLLLSTHSFNVRYHH